MPKRIKGFKLVAQDDAYGCGIACIAMVLGRPYADVAKDWITDFTTNGIDLDTIIEYLMHHGKSILMKHIACFQHKDFLRDEMLRPFAPIHIIRVMPCIDSAHSHVVVMTEDGKIYCPGGTSEEEIKSSYIVSHILGIY